MIDGEPTSPEGLSTAPEATTDGARLVTLVAWNVRARRTSPHDPTASPPGVTPLDAARCLRRAAEAWLALVRETHGTSVTHVHVHQFYNRVLLSLRRAPADREALAEPGWPPGLEGDCAEVARAFATTEARTGVLAVPLELSRTFFDRLRRRERPWRDEGNEKFHRYLARSAKWLAVAHKREVGLLPPRTRPGARARPDVRRVHDVLLDALTAPRMLALLLSASWLSAGVREVLRRQVAASSARAAPTGGAQHAVPPRALRPALVDALDRLASDTSYVPPLDPMVEALVGPLLRSKGAWDRPWVTWCAQLDPVVLREFAAWRLAGTARPTPAPLDPRLVALSAARLTEAAPAICEAVLPAVLAQFVAVLPNAHAAAAVLGDSLTGAIAADVRSGMTGAQIAARHGITPALVYKRLERLRRQVTAHLARTLAAFAPAPDASPPTDPSDG